MLIAALKDPDFGIRITAAKALGQMREPRAVGPLVEAMNDPNERNKTPYSYALSQINPPPVGSLIEMAKNSETCSSAVNALGATKDPRAFEPLLTLLKTPYPGAPYPYGEW